MKVIVADRREGKTTAMLEWLAAGHKIDTYPGWSRVLLVATEQEEQHLCLSLPPAPWKECIWSDWEYAARHAVTPGTVEYGVDNLDHLIHRVLGGRVSPVMVSMTGEIESLDNYTEPGGGLDV